MGVKCTVCNYEGQIGALLVSNRLELWLGSTPAAHVLVTVSEKLNMFLTLP